MSIIHIKSWEAHTMCVLSFSQSGAYAFKWPVDTAYLRVLWPYAASNCAFITCVVPSYWAENILGSFPWKLKILTFHPKPSFFLAKPRHFQLQTECVLFPRRKERGRERKTDIFQEFLKGFSQKKIWEILARQIFWPTFVHSVWLIQNFWGLCVWLDPLGTSTITIILLIIIAEVQVCQEGERICLPFGFTLVRTCQSTRKVIMDPANTTADGQGLIWAMGSLLKCAGLSTEIFSEG